MLGFKVTLTPGNTKNQDTLLSVSCMQIAARDCYFANNIIDSIILFENQQSLAAGDEILRARDNTV